MALVLNSNFWHPNIRGVEWQISGHVEVVKDNMDIQYQCAWKAAIDILAILCLLLFAGLSLAQPTPPTQKELDTLDAALKRIQASQQGGSTTNVPTPEQSAELSKIAEDFHRKHEPLSSEFNRLRAEIERSTQAPGFLVTNAHIQAAMVNHKKLRALYPVSYTHLTLPTKRIV